MPHASKAVKSTELTVCSCWSKEVTFVERRLIQSEISRKAHSLLNHKFYTLGIPSTDKPLFSNRCRFCFRSFLSKMQVLIKKVTFFLWSFIQRWLLIPCLISLLQNI